MENYILDLIEDNNRVIIPNFGAFIISKDDGINILFNNFLSFNDGLLVNYIAEQKNIDTITATDEVFNYVDNLKKELDSKGEFSINKLGTFKKDDSGMLRFFQDESIKVSDSESNTGEEDKTNSLLDIDPNSDATVEKEDKEVEKKIEEEVKKEEAIKEPVLTIDKTVEKKEEKPKIAAKTQTRGTSSKPSTAEKIKERKRKDIITFLIIAAVIIIGLGIYLFSTKKSDPVKPPVKQQETQIQKVDSAEIKRQQRLRAEQELAAFRADSLRKVEEARLSISNKYHLIVGSFKVEANASKMVKSLIEKGYNDAQFFEHNTKYFVSIGNNSKYGAIETLQQTILEKEKMGSWVFKTK